MKAPLARRCSRPAATSASSIRRRPTTFSGDPGATHALAQTGTAAVVREREVASPEDAARLSMHGSPTVRIDGRDPLASEDDHRRCRAGCIGARVASRGCPRRHGSSRRSRPDRRREWRTGASEGRALDAADRDPLTCRPDDRVSRADVVGDQPVVHAKAQRRGRPTSRPARSAASWSPTATGSWTTSRSPPLLERMARRGVDEIVVTTPQRELLGGRHPTEDTR